MEKKPIRRFDHAELVKDLRKQVGILENDLLERSKEEQFASALKIEYSEARKAERTATTYGAWREERVTQIAAAWVLGTVFIRFCEDNGLIEWPFIAGPGERLTHAVERHEAYFKKHPEKNDRDWIIAAFDHLASSHKTVGDLFDKRYNPLWEVTPSFEQAAALLTFWRRRRGDGEIYYDLTDDNWDTRFLGDLYQDLSEHVRKKYALLQTPDFVEEFILDLTLEPAIENFSLKGLRTIDPACGSGHFLLGIFYRLLEKWQEKPGLNQWERIYRSLESVHGCDKNPFAASIARFRLLVAALHAAGKSQLTKAAVFPINVAVGDSLLHGRGAPAIQGNLFESVETHTYRTEDVAEYRSIDLLGVSSYHVVVGNPPYITVKDKQENENYRRGYDSCSGTYALSVPFVQRLFQLAVCATHGAQVAGHVGQITANSFMKRDFGKKLIENFLPTVHLTDVIDTSGAYIPGHGTPTVILIGRNYSGDLDGSVRFMVSKLGEPSQPKEPAEGHVWSAIVAMYQQRISTSKWVSLTELTRSAASRHPWALNANESASVIEALSSSRRLLRNKIRSIGYTGQTNSDDVFLINEQTLLRRGFDRSEYREFVTGTEVRDYAVELDGTAIFPYDLSGSLRPLSRESKTYHHLWPYRTNLGSRATFNGSTYRKEGRPWWSWHQVAKTRLNGPVITWPMVQTHQHFAFLSSCALHNRHALMMQLPEGATIDEHLALTGLMNSSIACFWLKQVCHNKGNEGYQSGIKTEMWERFYEFAGNKLQSFPLPEKPPLAPGVELNRLALRNKELEPRTAKYITAPTRPELTKARIEQTRIRRRMIALQEELDWAVYESYKLTNNGKFEQLVANEMHSIPEIELGERAFEIVLARKLVAGEVETAWFDRHGSKPVTEIPPYWPEWYKYIVQARIDVINRRPDIALVERPEYKRRWVNVPWEKQESEALRKWLLDRCERSDLWFSLREGVNQPRTLTVSQLADQFRDHADINSVAQLYAADHLKKRDFTLVQTLEQVVADQHVPYLAALRYKDSGLHKREQWEHVWDLQREEDRTGKHLDIPVPPKYASGDFRKTSYWSQRGKLDVPKERFISYPDASPDSDSTMLLGWAGWDHKDQAQALVNVVNDRTEQSGWATEQLTPVLSGLREVMPWVKQWHGEYDDEWGGNPAEEYSAYLAEQRAKHQLTEDDLRAWRPAAPTRGRRTAK